jgi:hypothetical protein
MQSLNVLLQWQRMQYSPSIACSHVGSWYAHSVEGTEAIVHSIEAHLRPYVACMSLQCYSVNASIVMQK